MERVGARLSTRVTATVVAGISAAAVPYPAWDDSPLYRHRARGQLGQYLLDSTTFLEHLEYIQASDQGSFTLTLQDRSHTAGHLDRYIVYIPHIAIMDQMVGGGIGGQAGFPLETWFWEMPVCTRWWTTATVVTSALVQCQIVTPFQLFYSFRAVFAKSQVRFPSTALC